MITHRGYTIFLPLTLCIICVVAHLLYKLNRGANHTSYCFRALQKCPNRIGWRTRPKDDVASSKLGQSQEDACQAVGGCESAKTRARQKNTREPRGVNRT